MSLNVGAYLRDLESLADNRDHSRAFYFELSRPSTSSMLYFKFQIPPPPLVMWLPCGMNLSLKEMSLYPRGVPYKLFANF